MRHTWADFTNYGHFTGDTTVYSKVRIERLNYLCSCATIVEINLMSCIILWTKFKDLNSKFV